MQFGYLQLTKVLRLNNLLHLCCRDRLYYFWHLFRQSRLIEKHQQWRLIRTTTLLAMKAKHRSNSKAKALIPCWDIEFLARRSKRISISIVVFNYKELHSSYRHLCSLKEINLKLYINIKKANPYHTWLPLKTGKIYGCLVWLSYLWKPANKFLTTSDSSTVINSVFSQTPTSILHYKWHVFRFYMAMLLHSWVWQHVLLW